jgi:hypothetical protein
MTTLSFMTANYVARETGYRVTEGWMQGDDAVNAYFAPVETYAARFAALLAEIQGLGFTAIDLWLAHLNWRWATGRAHRHRSGSAPGGAPAGGEPGRAGLATRRRMWPRPVASPTAWVRRSWAATAR